MTSPLPPARANRWPLPLPMAQALDQARLAAAAGEVPVGAVVVKDGAVKNSTTVKSTGGME